MEGRGEKRGEVGGRETQGRAQPSLLGPGAQALPAWEGVTEFCWELCVGTVCVQAGVVCQLRKMAGNCVCVCV